MGTPVDDLKTSLSKLKKQLGSIKESSKEEELISKVETILELCGLIDPKNEMDDQQIDHILELSDKVIELRNDNRCRSDKISDKIYKTLCNLAIPPYDLWLPFKAQKGPCTNHIKNETGEYDFKVSSSGSTKVEKNKKRGSSPKTKK